MLSWGEAQGSCSREEMISFFGETTQIIRKIEINLQLLCILKVGLKVLPLLIFVVNDMTDAEGNVPLHSGSNTSILLLFNFIHYE